jgi:hypothetical protein
LFLSKTKNKQTNKKQWIRWVGSLLEI